MQGGAKALAMCHRLQRDGFEELGLLTMKPKR